MLKDVYGNVIKRGTMIVYPARKGSGMWLTQATVTKVNEKFVTDNGWRWNKALNRYIKGEPQTKTVYEVEAIRNGEVVGAEMIDVNARPVKLTRTNHLLVVS